MELILFIILALILFVRIGSENSAAKIADKRIARSISWFRARQQAWQEQVSDRALEEDLKFFIADPRNYDKVWEEVHEAYLQMPTYKSYTTILLHEQMVLRYYGKGAYSKKQRENIAEYERDRALNIMLAKRGKVCRNGVQDRSTLDSLGRGEGRHSKKVWDETIEFWTFIRDELRRNGVNARLIFKMGAFNDMDSIAYDVDDIEKFRYQAGLLTWLPLTYYDENLRYAL